MASSSPPASAFSPSSPSSFSPPPPSSLLSPLPSASQSPNATSETPASLNSPPPLPSTSPPTSIPNTPPPSSTLTPPPSQADPPAVSPPPPSIPTLPPPTSPTSSPPPPLVPTLPPPTPTSSPPPPLVPTLPPSTPTSSPPPPSSTLPPPAPPTSSPLPPLTPTLPPQTPPNSPSPPSPPLPTPPKSSPLTPPVANPPVPSPPSPVSVSPPPLRSQNPSTPPPERQPPAVPSSPPSLPNNSSSDTPILTNPPPLPSPNTPPVTSSTAIIPNGNKSSPLNPNVTAEIGNVNNSGGGGTKNGVVLPVAIVTTILVLSLVGLAIWYFRKRKRRTSGYGAGFVVPSPHTSSQISEGGRPVMDWTIRVKVAAGAARGIAYLHEDCHPRIIHRDIKSSNILLDNNYEAQVSDFGLARLAMDAVTHVTTRVMGTFGYMAPEYASSGKLTERSDAYSFGVVLLELITGRKPVDTSQPLGDESLVEWARPLLTQALETGDFDSLTDPRLEKNYNEREMFRMIETAAACIRHSAPMRPRMGLVLRALDGLADVDLSNGLKPGQSELFPVQSSEIRLFQRMAFGSQDYSSDFSNFSNFSKTSRNSQRDS